MNANQPDGLDRIIAEVTTNVKYKMISPDLIRWVAQRELNQTKSFKEALKATRTKLHQVGGAYQENKIDYARCLESLAAAIQINHEAHQTMPLAELRQPLIACMTLHASTRERLSILDDFYHESLKSLGPIHSILDLACGLNPLAADWIPLAPGAPYYAYDIYQDMVDFLNQAFALLGMAGEARQINLLQAIPNQHVQLALLLKTLPCLEQLDKSISSRLLEAIDADYLLVSYPVYSLGGRSKGMRSFYGRRFKELIAGRPWKVETFDFATELVYLVSK